MHRSWKRVCPIFGGLTAACVALAIYILRIAPRWLEVVRLRVSIPVLPDSMVGLRIAHLSDFHAGGSIPLEFLRRAKAIAIADSPDVIALTGDFYDEGVYSDVGNLFTDWPDDVPVLAVLGNHDHRATPEALALLHDELQSAGVQMLSNRAVRVMLAGVPSWVVGVDDPFSWNSDETRAFEDLPADADALLYLAHSPVAIESLPVGRVLLMLSGHTHGGQVRLTPDGRVPFIRPIRRLRGVPARPDPDVHRGVHWRRGAILVISNGLGLSKMPWRFRTRPQVILITLDRAAEDGPPCDDVDRYVERLNPTRRWVRWLS